MSACAQERLASVVEARLIWLVAVPALFLGFYGGVWLVVRWVVGL